MLITFEGIDGCGKSTQIDKLGDYFESEGYRFRVFREPGGTRVSEQIRDILLNSREDIHPVAETLLFAAARAQLVADEMRPLLSDGYIVILDRFYDSTTAYQGYGRRVMSISDIEKLNALATSGLQPDLTFYLKIDPREAAARRGEQGQEDRMERSGPEFFRRVSDGFDRLASRTDRVVQLDATEDPEVIFQKILSCIKERLPR